MTRQHVNEAAFGLWIVAFFTGLVAAVAGPRPLVLACAAVFVACWLVGRLTIPRFEPVACSDCAGLGVPITVDAFDPQCDTCHGTGLAGVVNDDHHDEEQP